MKYLYNSYLYQNRVFSKFYLLSNMPPFHVTHISIDFSYVSPDILLSGPRRYSSPAGLLRPPGGGNTAGAPPFPLDGRRAGNDPSTALSMAGGSAANPGEGRGRMGAQYRTTKATRRGIDAPPAKGLHLWEATAAVSGSTDSYP